MIRLPIWTRQNKFPLNFKPELGTTLAKACLLVLCKLSNIQLKLSPILYLIKLFAESTFDQIEIVASDLPKWITL